MTGVKLTDVHGRTCGGTQWGPGVMHEASGTGPLCKAGWIHLYDSALVAAFMNPIHGNFRDPRFWECEWSGATLDDHGLMRGVQICTTVREIPAIVPTTEQSIAFGIYAEQSVTTDAEWRRWAERWLSGEDRTCESARAAEAAALAAEWVARAAEVAAPIDIAAIARRAMEFES